MTSILDFENIHRPRTTFDTPPVLTVSCKDIAGNPVIIEEYRLGVLRKFIARIGVCIYEFSSLEEAKEVLKVADDVDLACVETMKIDLIRVFNLIEDILYEAQNNPLRLVAFNSPLLGIALLEAWKHKNLHASAEEWKEVERQISEFRAVVEANRKRENGI